ncbi:hypothetical protein V2J09_004982 [Rumex salicifolius]
MTTAPDSKDVNYSAAATLIHFDRPLPLLRGPIRAGTDDDPSLGPNLLAFRNAKSFFSAQNFCRSKLLSQCEAGVRIGCSLSASMKCKPPWWKLLIGGGGGDFKERERCEEREMANCLQESKGKCEKFAEEKTSAVFRSARVAQRRRWKIREKAAADFVGWISLLGPEKIDLEKGSELLASDSYSNPLKI